MDKILQKLQNMEDSMALLQEEVSSYKMKVIKLERRLKESQDKIERLESQTTSAVNETSRRQTGNVNNEIAVLKQQCEDVNNKCERLTKLQHVLNSFILKSRDSSKCQKEVESLRNDFGNLSKTVKDLQTAVTTSKKVENLQKDFNQLSRTVRELQTALNSSQKTSSSNIVLDSPGPSASSAYFSSICREVTIVQESGILKYTSASQSPLGYPVGQFVSAKPLTKECPSFSFRIMSAGITREITIGVCPRGYPANRQPGWNAGSVAYHADDGGIYDGNGHSQLFFEPCTTDDVMKCQVDFPHKAVMFFKNGRKVYTSLRTQPLGALTLYAAVGMKSPGEVVMLLETEPWQM